MGVQDVIKRIIHTIT